MYNIKTKTLKIVAQTNWVVSQLALWSGGTAVSLTRQQQRKQAVAGLDAQGTPTAKASATKAHASTLLWLG